MRKGISDTELLAFIGSVWGTRTDRYSADRLAALRSEKGYDPRSHRKIEMITLGG
jgi:hypothetical protein